MNPHDSYEIQTSSGDAANSTTGDKKMENSSSQGTQGRRYSSGDTLRSRSGDKFTESTGVVFIRLRMFVCNRR